MSHIVSRQAWGVIDVDAAAGSVFLQQNWHYTWQLFSAAVAPWTTAEKRHFHNTLDRQIWGLWSHRVRLHVAGANDFGRRFAATGVTLNFDIRWVLAHGDWDVTVRKMPAGSKRTTFRSNVNFATRRIELDTMDLQPSAAGNAAGKATANFLSGPHEFGHALRAPDEYGAASSHLADTQSIMNVGRRLRPRHLDLVVTTLNGMMPGVSFSAPTTIP